MFTLDWVWWKLSLPGVMLGSLKTVATLTPNSATVDSMRREQTKQKEKLGINQDLYEWS